MKKKVSIPKPSGDLLNYIYSHHLSLEDVAQNLISKRRPHGIHAGWLSKLIKRGMSKDDADTVKAVVDKLSKLKEN